MSKEYKTKEEVYSAGKGAEGKTLKDFIPIDKLGDVEKDVAKYGTNRKGLLGNLVENYIFEIDNNSRAEADFPIPGVELKTTPIKKSGDSYVSKERLVFSMIDYVGIADEKWETSSFLKKNGLLLLMFYLYSEDKTVLEYVFKYVYLLDLMNDISEEDAEQIRKDWEYIVAKIRRGEAHLLSEGDTFYLGACTKGANSSIRRSQYRNDIPAKPRAFSLKQSYLNYLIKERLGKDSGSISIAEEDKDIEKAITKRFSKYIGKTDKEIARISGLDIVQLRKSKNYKKILANIMIGGSGSNRIEELDKAGITMKAITLEPSGILKESISFSAFDYMELLDEKWYDERTGDMADFHEQLELKKFLFVIFRKIGNTGDILLERVKLWNFPIKDIPEAESVFKKTLDCVKSGDYARLPKISESKVAHVRPHARNSNDKIPTPQKGREVKRAFWLNAKYIEAVVSSGLGNT